MEGRIITEQWLLGAGFEQQWLSDGSAYYYTLELNDDECCNLCLCSGDKNGYLEVTLFPYEDWFRYRYVHEVQNLYKSITGKELKHG